MRPEVNGGVTYLWRNLAQALTSHIGILQTTVQSAIGDKGTVLSDVLHILRPSAIASATYPWSHDLRTSIYITTHHCQSRITGARKRRER